MGEALIRRTSRGKWQVHLGYAVYGTFDSYWEAFQFKVRKSLEGWL